MQILNISVMNRPSKSITSRPYAAESLESIGFTCSMDTSQSNLAMQESQSYTAGIYYGTIRDLLVTYKLRPEPMSYSAGVYDVQVTYEVVYNKTSISPEKSQYHAGLYDAKITREVRYITQSIDTEASTYSAGVLDVQITK